jgi:TonB family protein
MKLKSVAFCLSVLCTPGLMAKQNPSHTAPAAQAQQPHRIHVKEDVEKAKLIHTVSPMYPPLTGKRVDGTVVLHVLIGKNGAVKSAKYVSGPETCGSYAVKAVLQWRYEPTLINGVPVEVDTTVSVVFPPLVKQGPSVTNK